MVVSDAGVAVLVRATTSRVGWSSFQSWTGKEHHEGHRCSGKMGPKEYEESTGTKVPEVAKVYAIKQVMPAELQHDMQRLSSQMKTHMQARAYIMDQVLTRRDPWFGDEKKTRSDGPVPIELDAFQKSQISGEHVDAMGSTLHQSNFVGDEQSDDTAELNALRKGGFPAVNLDTRSLNAERRMKKWQRKECKDKAKTVGNTVRRRATRIPGVPGGKGKVQAKAGARKEATAGQVGSRRER